MTSEERIADLVQGLESSIQLVQGFSQAMKALADAAREAAEKLEVFLALAKAEEAAAEEVEDEEPLDWDDELPDDYDYCDYGDDDLDYDYYGVDRWGN